MEMNLLKKLDSLLDETGEYAIDVSTNSYDEHTKENLYDATLVFYYVNKYDIENDDEWTYGERKSFSAEFSSLDDMMRTFIHEIEKDKKEREQKINNNEFAIVDFSKKDISSDKEIKDKYIEAVKKFEVELGFKLPPIEYITIDDKISYFSIITFVDGLTLLVHDYKLIDCEDNNISIYMYKEGLS